MARAMWKGAIQFGLVTIPVKLYLATESKSQVSFNLLHATDRSRIQMKIWCPVDERVVPRTETVRGYEWAADQYVVITDKELEQVPLRTLRAIEIEQFVRRDGGSAAGPIRFVKQAYYVEPERIGRKAFQLLREVLAERGLTAICKVVIKDREALAALDPFDRTMLLTTLHWPDEIRSAEELDLGDEEPAFKPNERAMAEQLVAAMTGEFDPAAYRDEYRAAVLKVIEAKVEGLEPVEPPAQEASTLIDLMAALEASVAAATAARTATSGEPVSVAGAARARAARSTRRAGAAPAAQPPADVVPARSVRRRKSA